MSEQVSEEIEDNYGVDETRVVVAESADFIHDVSEVKIPEPTKRDLQVDEAKIIRTQAVIRGYLVRKHFRMILKSMYTPVTTIAKKIEESFFKISITTKKDLYIKRPDDVVIRLNLKNVKPGSKPQQINITQREAQKNIFQHLEHSGEDSEKAVFEKGANYHEALVNSLVMEGSRCLIAYDMFHKAIGALKQIFMIDNSFEEEPKSPQKSPKKAGTPKRKELRSVMQMDVNKLIKVQALIKGYLAKKQYKQMVNKEFKMVGTYMRKFEDGKVYNIFFSCRRNHKLTKPQQVVLKFVIRDIRNVRNIETLEVTANELETHVLPFVEGGQLKQLLASRELVQALIDSIR